MQRRLVVGEAHHRLDAAREHGVEEPIVVGESLLIGLLLVALGENARPADGGAQGPQAQLHHEIEVPLVAVVEVDGLVAGVEAVKRGLPLLRLQQVAALFQKAGSP